MSNLPKDQKPKVISPKPAVCINEHESKCCLLELFYLHSDDI